MSIYLIRAKYSPEAFKGMLAKPEDRTATIKAFYEAAGVKLLHLWYSPMSGEIIAITEGTLTQGIPLGIVSMAAGTVTEGSSLELVTMEQLAEGMKAAGALAAKFRPPGK
jgi:uncharacterized protein with GYD domain